MVTAPVETPRRGPPCGATLPSVRPQLTPAVRRLWRDRETLQLGRSRGAVVLAGVDAAARAVLGLLDGTRDEAALVAAASAAGSPPPQTARVLALLADAGVHDDAADPSPPCATDRSEREQRAADRAALRLVRGPTSTAALRRRAGSGVVVVGAGRVGAAVAGLLAAAGVGAVQVVDDGLVRPADCGPGGIPLSEVGRRRDAAATALLGSGVRTGRLLTPDLVLLAPPAGEPLPEPPRQVPHLVAEARDGVGVVGPLVRPGLSACLRCLDLARSDRDPDWPALAVQLATASGAALACDSALALAVAAQAALQAVSLLDDGGLPAAVGGTLELTPPDWRWRRRSWQLHPGCDCHGYAAAPASAVAARPAAAQATLEA